MAGQAAGGVFAELWGGEVKDVVMENRDEHIIEDAVATDALLEARYLDLRRKSSRSILTQQRWRNFRTAGLPRCSGVHGRLLQMVSGFGSHKIPSSIRFNLTCGMAMDLSARLCFLNIAQRCS